MNIQRFDPLSDMSKQSFGHYVRYSDYEALSTELVSRLANAERALYSTAHESGVWKYLEKHREQWPREA